MYIMNYRLKIEDDSIDFEVIVTTSTVKPLYDAGRGTGRKNFETKYRVIASSRLGIVELC